jgi:hypothetical protein|tara:strand:+ start:5242 stop:5511 length:270 start_codon:yes stop_codon:yes gene_type:complete
MGLIQMLEQYRKGFLTFVSEEKAQERIEICKGNEKYAPCEKYMKLTGQCKSCGCVLKMKTKVEKRKVLERDSETKEFKWHTEKCPENKW